MQWNCAYALLTREQENTESGPLTMLKVSDFLGQPARLAELVWWPARLEVFDLSVTYNIDYAAIADDDGKSPDSGLAMLCEILSAHQATLRILRICNLVTTPPSSPDHPGLSRVDLRSFSALTHLTLSRHTTGTDSRTAYRLLAPRLRVFCWDLTGENCLGGENLGGETLGDLCQPEEDWLRALTQAATAAKEARTGSSALYRIEIDYAPTIEFGCNDGIYPWTRLEKVADEMRRVNIALWWDVPSVSKEEFEEVRKVHM